MSDWKKILKTIAYLVSFIVAITGFRLLEFNITLVAAQTGETTGSEFDLDRLLPLMPEYYDLDGQDVFDLVGQLSGPVKLYNLAVKFIPLLKNSPQVPRLVPLLGSASKIVSCYHEKDALKTHAYFDKAELLEVGVIALLNKDELLNSENLLSCTLGSIVETPAEAEPGRETQSVKRQCTHYDYYSLAPGSNITYAFAGTSEKVCTDLCNGLPGCTKYQSKDNQIPIVFDEPIIGEVAANAVWTFYGEAGQVVTIAMDDYYSGIDTYVTLLGPDGQELSDDNNGGYGTNSLINGFVLPAYGTYTIIPDAHPGETGAYLLRISSETLPTEDPPEVNSSPPSPLDWIFIPSGDFTMGSSEADIQAALNECNATEGFITGQPCQPNWFYSEMPPQTIFVNDFEITTYEITNAQYNTCVTAGACQPAGRSIAADSTIGYDPSFFSDNYPVVGVSWYDASAFCSWAGGRLPTEIEWEKAARGNDGRRYPWGNTFESWRANLDTGYPMAVGSYWDGASPYGVMDMAGNVFEWTATPAGDNYVLRGGGWSKYYFRGRTTDHGTQLPASYANYDIGFRCAR